MHTLRSLGILLICCLTSNIGLSAVQSKTVEYTDNEITMKGYLAWDDKTSTPRPGILVVHEWWGNNEYAHKRARMLAEAGYLALAIDMYGDGKVAKHPDQASAFSSAAMASLPTAEKRFNAAADLLNKHPLMQKNQLGAIGYCFGGGVVLHMARAGANLKSVASFHGTLTDKIKAEKNKIKPRILVLHGADDAFIPQEKVKAFEDEMQNAQADFKVIQYPGATHSFTNPDADVNGKKFKLPLAYNKEADEKSWQTMLDFLAESFK